MKTLKNFPVKGKNVLLRVDLNVPVHDGIIIDKTRLHGIKSTVRELCSSKNKVFLLSHFGRPKGQLNNQYTLECLTGVLADILSVEKIYFVSSCYGEKVKQQIKLMKPGEICLLENVRFNKDEEKNDSNFSKLLAEYFDVYINDAFSASHRNHASIVGVTRYLPSLAGNSFIKEIENLDKLLNKTSKQTTVIIGGSKVSTKLKLLKNIVKICNTLIIGGAMANTFLLAKGFNMGKSLVEENLLLDANRILEKSKNFETDVVLPVDLVCSNSIDDTNNIRLVDVKNLYSNQMALDIGYKSISLIKSIIIKSDIILWNGPLGAFEYKPYDNSTNEITKIIKNYAPKLNITTIAGGGDTIAAIKRARAEKSFTYISAAGGAFLEWLEGKESPGVKALKENSLS